MFFRCCIPLFFQVDGREQFFNCSGDCHSCDVWSAALTVWKLLSRPPPRKQPGLFQGRGGWVPILWKGSYLFRFVLADLSDVPHCGQAGIFLTLPLRRSQQSFFFYNVSMHQQCITMYQHTSDIINFFRIWNEKRKIAFYWTQPNNLKALPHSSLAKKVRGFVHLWSSAVGAQSLTPTQWAPRSSCNSWAMCTGRTTPHLFFLKTFWLWKDPCFGPRFSPMANFFVNLLSSLHFSG